MGTAASAVQSGVNPLADVAQGYSIDTRTIRPGELFFAVKGERLDGHDYVGAALEKGAAGAVVQNNELHRYADRTRLLAVDDTLVALQVLATAVRKIWGKPLVGVTGSAGKTTTKEAIAHVLSSGFRVLKSEGNFNNHFGLPLMLLKLEPEHDVAVIEMGMSHAGEIRALAKIAQPEIGVVTNVAPVHLEFFDSDGGIARAKYELIESLPANGIAVLNADDEFVSQFGRDFKGKVITYGTEPPPMCEPRTCKLAAQRARSSMSSLAGKREHARLPLVGEHNILNALAAVAVGLARGLKASDVVAALATLAPPDKRGQVLQLGNITVINDCYNSNPKALHAMVDALAAMKAGRRIVVAGEMLELGPAGEQMHRAAGQHVAEKKIDVLVGCSRAGAGNGRGRAALRDAGRFRGHARRSRRMAGSRGARWRRSAVKGVTGRKTRKSARDMESPQDLKPAKLRLETGWLKRRPSRVCIAEG